MAGRRVRLGGLAVVAAGLGAGWAGLRMPPAPFDPPASVYAARGSAEPPPDLPTPVRRFFSVISPGQPLPRIEQAVVSGRGRMRPFGVWLPMRYRFTYVPGEQYHHHIETTWYGRPLFRADERYQDGRCTLRLPFGTVEGEPKVDEAAWITLWAEAVAFPAAWLDASRVRWEPVDAAAARMIISDRGYDHPFDLNFDPDTGLLAELRTLRYRDAADEARTGWSVIPVRWRRFGPLTLPATTLLRWQDQRGPWAVWNTEYVAFNQ